MRDRLVESRRIDVCLPLPGPAELPRFRPKLDLQFDPNPFRGKCDGRAIRLDERPAKLLASDPPPIVSLFPSELRLGAPQNFFAECPPIEDEDCGPEIPRRPLSPDGFVYPTIREEDIAARPTPPPARPAAAACEAPARNPCSVPIQQPFRRTRYPAFLSIETGNAPFPIQGPPEPRPRENDCDCRDESRDVEFTRYPDTLDMDYGAMNFPLRGPEPFVDRNCGKCDVGPPVEDQR